MIDDGGGAAHDRALHDISEAREALDRIQRWLAGIAHDLDRQGHDIHARKGAIGNLKMAAHYAQRMAAQLNDHQ